MPQQGQGYHFPSESEPNYGYGQPAQPQWGQQPDPGGYDLGNYMPVGGQAYQPDPGQFQAPDPHGHYGPAQRGYAESDADYDEFTDDDEPRSSRRWMLIVAALVGAIGVGGALAYTYKSFIAPNGGRVPLVKADPKVKVKPESRGGREFPNADKKMLNRLAEDGGQQKEADAQDDRPGDDSGGPKRVRTIAITPGAGPPVAQAPPAVPGIMLDNVGPPRAPPVPPKAAQPPPQRVTIGQPPPPPLLPPAQTEDPLPPPTARKVVAAQPPPAARPPLQAKAREAAPAPEPPPAANTTGAGYVAVLSAQKSRMDALKVFADMQQKYGDVLASKTPDVQQADLSARGLGTMYRLVVGPPGSRSAASGICSQLKSAGFEGCWVKEY